MSEDHPLKDLLDLTAGAVVNDGAGAARDSDDSELARVVETYLADLEAGKKPAVEELLARHPRIAERLSTCLANLQFVEQAAAPLAAPEAQARSNVPGGAAMRLGDFRILKEIGRGGMGIVYEVEQISLSRRVALKVLPFAAVLDPKQIQRFKNESHAAAQLHHTNIVPVFSVGVERGVHFNAMQFIEGQSLSEVIQDLKNGKKDGNNPLSSSSTKSRNFINAAAQLTFQAAEALDYAHEMGIIHRDVKPANFLLDSRGKLWIADFGLARCRSDASLTMSGDLVGTLRYMSPEQALAKRITVDQRTDIYSFGVTLHELLTLEPAFQGKDREELLKKIAFEEPKPPRRLNKAIPVDLETIILKAIVKDPDGRYGSAREVAEDLKRFLEDRPVIARRPGVIAKTLRWCRRRKKMVAAAAAMLVLSLTAGGLYLKQRHEALTALYRALVLEAVERLGGSQTREDFREVLHSDPLNKFEIQQFLTLAPASAEVSPVLQAVRLLGQARAIFPGLPDAYYHRARAQHFLKEDEEALKDLAVAMTRDPSFAPARILKAMILRQQGKQLEAEAELSRARQETPDPGSRAAALWIEAHEALAARRWSDAAAAYKKILEVQAPGQERYVGSAIELRLGRGYALQDAGDYLGAVEEFSAGAALWSGAVEPLLALGRTYRYMGEKEKCDEKFNQAFLKSQDRLGASLENMYFYMYEGNNKKVLEWAEKISVPSIREFLRVYPLWMQGRLGEADEAARKFMNSLGPGDPLLVLGNVKMGEVGLNKGEYEKGMEFYQKAKAAAGSPELLAYIDFSLGVCLKNFQDRRLEALAALDEGAKMSPRSWDMLINRGGVLNLLGRHEEALQSYQKVIEIQPRDYWAFLFMGLTHLKLRQEDPASDCFKKALELRPKVPWILTKIGGGYREIGKFDEAARYYQETLAADPGYLEAYHGLGMVKLYDLKQPRKAIPYYEKALARDPKVWWAHLDLGNAYKALGDLPQAAESFARMIECNPDFPSSQWSSGASRELIALFKSESKTPELEAKLKEVQARLEKLRAEGNNHPLLLDILTAAAPVTHQK